MDKTLTFRFASDNLIITLEKELSNFHKSKLNINEKKYKEETTKIAAEVKYVKGFKRFTVGFGQIDWYESCGTFFVPYFNCTDENKRVKTESYDCNDVPKDWTVNYTLILENPDSVRGINKYLDALNVHLSDSEINQIRKALKDKKSLNFEV